MGTVIQQLAAAAFGRDIAQFYWLIDFLTWLSLILWACVALSTLIRAGAYVAHVRHRRHYGATHTKTTSEHNGSY